MSKQEGLLGDPTVTELVTAEGIAARSESRISIHRNTSPGWRNGKRRGLKIPRGKPLVSSILTPGISFYLNVIALGMVGPGS